MSTKSFFDLILTARQNDPEALRTARALWSAHTAGCIEPPLLPSQAAVLEQVIGEDGMRQAIEEDPTYVYTTNLLVCRHRMLISFHIFRLSSDEYQSQYAAVTLWCLNSRQLLDPPLSPADHQYLREYILRNCAETMTTLDANLSRLEPPVQTASLLYLVREHARTTDARTTDAMHTTGRQLSKRASWYIEHTSVSSHKHINEH